MGSETVVWDLGTVFSERFWASLYSLIAGWSFTIRPSARKSCLQATVERLTSLLFIASSADNVQISFRTSAVRDMLKWGRKNHRHIAPNAHVRNWRTLAESFWVDQHVVQLQPNNSAGPPASSPKHSYNAPLKVSQRGSMADSLSSVSWPPDADPCKGLRG